MPNKHKSSSNAQAFEREVKRLQRIVKIAENKGIVFLSSPIPQKPKRVTPKRLSVIKGITKLDIESQGYTIDKETGELSNYVPAGHPKPRQTARRKYGKVLPEESAIKRPNLAKKRAEARRKWEKEHPEEAKARRSEVAKKAAQARKEREANDPEYAKRAQEQRRKALEKAREALRKREQEHPEEAKARRSEAAKKAAETRRKREATDPEYAKRTQEQRRKALEKAREALRKKREQSQTTPEEPVPPPPEEPDYSSLPTQRDVILENVRSELNGAENENTANFLLDLLDEEIVFSGEEAVVERLATAPEQSIELANGVAYASDPAKLANCAYSLAYLVLGEVPPITAQKIEGLAFEDRPYYRRY